MVEKSKKEDHKEESSMSAQLQELLDREEYPKALKYCSTRKSYNLPV